MHCMWIAMLTLLQWTLFWQWTFNRPWTPWCKQAHESPTLPDTASLLHPMWRMHCMWLAMSLFFYCTVNYFPTMNPLRTVNSVMHACSWLPQITWCSFAAAPYVTHALNVACYTCSFSIVLWALFRQWTLYRTWTPWCTQSHDSPTLHDAALLLHPMWCTL